MTGTRKIGVDCIFSAADRDFLTADGPTVVDKLIDELDGERIGNQPGKLVFEPVSQALVARIEMESVFRCFASTRIYITRNNNEAVNMLMNKLIRRGITEHPGKLSFEYIPRGAVASICICGHNRYAHKRDRRGWADRGRCEATGCYCRRYKEEAISD